MIVTFLLYLTMNLILDCYPVFYPQILIILIALYYLYLISNLSICNRYFAFKLKFFIQPSCLKKSLWILTTTAVGFDFIRLYWYLPIYNSTIIGYFHLIVKIFKHQWIIIPPDVWQTVHMNWCFIVIILIEILPTLLCEANFLARSLKHYLFRIIRIYCG